MNPDRMRAIPAVHHLLDDPRVREVIHRHGRSRVVDTVRRVLDEARKLAAGGQEVETSSILAARVVDRLDRSGFHLQPVINATGILLHTGLGRAPLAAEAVETVSKVALGYSNLEFDLESGTRGRRTDAVSRLLSEISGAGAATVVNNNAGATLLALRALASGREVVVSRGQLVEIGGSYRLPEVFEASGARLREVGTTNKTRLHDYEAAIGEQTAALLRVHSSNYRIVGFTEEVPIAPMAELARRRGVYCIDDLGSGALRPGSPPNVSEEPTVRESLDAGADLALFSGDKLLGGPQCGILVGRREVIQRLESDPLMRALRVDKMTLAALEATLRLAADPDLGRSQIPLWRFLSRDLDSLKEEAVTLADCLRRDGGWSCDAEPSTAFPGGGSSPVHPLPSWSVRVHPPLRGGIESVTALARRLRTGRPAVVGRVQEDALILDLRTLSKSDLETVAKILVSIAGGESQGEAGGLPKTPDGA